MTSTDLAGLAAYRGLVVIRRRLLADPSASRLSHVGRLHFLCGYRQAVNDLERELGPDQRWRLDHIRGASARTDEAA